MKRILLITLTVLAWTLSYSQSHWADKMGDESINFYEVQEDFNAHWENREIEKGKGFKQYKRWEHFMEPRVYPDGVRFAPNAAAKNYEKWRIDNPGMKSLTGTWTYVGNQAVPTSGGGAGRINAIRYDQANGKLYACAPAGGLWVSSDNGTSWSTITEELEHIGTTDVLIDPIDPNILYLATGDGDGGDTYALGVLKSTDGGSTWQETGLDWTYNQTRRISRMVMHPTNNNVILAATSNGIWKTIDAGSTWNQTFSGNFKDIELHPSNPDVVYISGASFYRSIDGGENFIQVGTDQGLLDSNSRMAVSVSADSSDYVYVLVGNNGDGFVGMFRSTDSGVTFEERSNSPNLLGWNPDGTDSGGQAWYDLSLTVDPNDARVVYTGGVNVWKSSDGGVSWSLSGHWYGGGGADYVHADIHSLDFLDGKLYVGCDGGVFESADNGTVYDDKSGNLEIAQMYRLGTSATVDDLVITGWQDNGTNLKDGTNWSRVIGGDGMESLIDWSDPSVRFGELYYGNIRRSTGGGYSTWVSSGGTGVNRNGNWVTPYIQDPTDPDVFYVGKDSLYKTTDDGATWVGLFEPTGSNIDEIAACPSNPDYVYCSVDNDIFLTTDGGLTHTEVTNNLPNRYITYIAVSDTDENKVWVTMSGFNSNEKVFMSADAGANWTNVSSGLPNVPVNCIVYQNGSNDAVYCGTDVGVFFRNDAYTTWQPFTNGMPSIVISELEIHYLSSSLYAATYGRGLWKSDLFSTLELDAGVAQIIHPTGTECTTEVEGQVLLQNFGNNNLTSVDLNYSFDGGAIQTINWTGNLTVGQSEIVLLPLETLDVGTHMLDAYTSSPNGGNDEFPLNNQRSQEFALADQELLVKIITDRWGAETTWEVLDENNVKVAGGGPYTTTESNGEYPQADEQICIPTGCFDFVIYDSYGDGMCCAYGNGSYAVTTLAGDTLFSGGEGWDDSDTTAFCAPHCPADVDGDGDVDIDDFLDLNSVYASECYGCSEDIDGNGVVDVDDFLAFNSAFGQDCSSAFTDDEFQLAPEILDHLRLGSVHPQLKKDIDSMMNPYGLSIHPNPNNGHSLYVLLENLTLGAEMTLSLHDLSGRSIKKEVLKVESGKMNHLLEFENRLASGLYTLRLSMSDQVMSKKLVVE